MAVTRRVQSLEESESKLKVEVSRLKEVAEVASHQTEAIKAQQESQDRELTSLRKQLYDMQMESDDKTIIGINIWCKFKTILGVTKILTLRLG